MNCKGVRQEHRQVDREEGIMGDCRRGLGYPGGFLGDNLGFSNEYLRGFSCEAFEREWDSYLFGVWKNWIRGFMRHPEVIHICVRLNQRAIHRQISFSYLIRNGLRSFLCTTTSWSPFGRSSHTVFSAIQQATQRLSLLYRDSIP